MADDKPVLVIGGITGGIGSCIAARMLARDWRVCGFARSEERLEQLRNTHSELETYTADATDPDSLQGAFDAILKAHGRIDAYVHAIGSILLKPAQSTTDKDWDATLLLNLTSAFYSIRSLVKIMQKQNRGRLVYFSTVAAQIGVGNHEAIAAAKGGLEALVRSTAATYVSRGIRANAIAPGLVDTPLSEGITGNPTALEYSRRMHPTNTIGTPNNIAGLCEYLLSDDGDWATGQVFPVDGGMSSLVAKPKA